MSEKTSIYSIENYIFDEKSICREERQYALFLNNILYKYKKPNERSGEIAEMFDVCHIPSSAEIINVFYEAAFMRDYFHKNRKCGGDSFNKKLIRYVSKKGVEYKGDEVNLGRNKFQCQGLSEDEKYTAKWMMEAKPDLAVIYSLGGKRYLHFLECKFESNESVYKVGDFEKNQCKIQWMIADFLCDRYLSDLNVSDIMKANGMSCLVQFVREKPKNANEIPIDKLINLNNEIFS